MFTSSSHLFTTTTLTHKERCELNSCSTFILVIVLESTRLRLNFGTVGSSSRSFKSPSIGSPPSPGSPPRVSDTLSVSRAFRDRCSAANLPIGSRFPAEALDRYFSDSAWVRRSLSRPALRNFCATRHSARRKRNGDDRTDDDGSSRSKGLRRCEIT